MNLIGSSRLDVFFESKHEALGVPGIGNRFHMQRRSAAPGNQQCHCSHGIKPDPYSGARNWIDPHRRHGFDAIGREIRRPAREKPRAWRVLRAVRDDFATIGPRYREDERWRHPWKAGSRVSYLDRGQSPQGRIPAFPVNIPWLEHDSDWSVGWSRNCRSAFAATSVPAKAQPERPRKIQIPTRQPGLPKSRCEHAP